MKTISKVSSAPPALATTALATTALVAALVAAALATPALAADKQSTDKQVADKQAADKPEGRFQFKLLATSVQPGGSLSSVNDPYHLTAPGAPLAGLTATSASNNVTPTIAVEYFIKPSISVETIAGISAHSVSSPSLGGAGLIDHALVVPFTLTAKYHFLGLLPAGIKPYVGAGPTLFTWLSDRPSAVLQGGVGGAIPGITRTKMTSNLGGVIQAGLDVPVGHGYSISLDAKKYFVSTTAHFYTASLGDTLDAKVRLNPWVVSAGVAYRF